jgi:hypothetical protein
MTDDKVLPFPRPPGSRAAKAAARADQTEELKELIYDMLGPVLCWAEVHARRREMPAGEISPGHQELVDRAHKVLGIKIWKLP